MQLSTNFTLSEFTRSSSAVKFGINNTPNDSQVSNLKLLCNSTLQPFRNYCNKPIIITSGFRSAALNSHWAVKGSSGSYHLRGLAADIKVTGFTSYTLSAAFLRFLWLSGCSPRDYEIITYPAAAGGHLHIAYRV